MRIKWNGSEWVDVPEGVQDDQALYFDPMLKEKLEIIRVLIKKKFDCVIIIDGEERSGKSTLGLTIGSYLSNMRMSVDNVCSGMEDIKKKIRDIKPSTPDNIQVLMPDESSLVFNSKDAMQRANKTLMKVMDVIGQKGLVFIMILPSFFDLNKTIALRRSKALIHVYVDRQNYDRGRYAYFGTREKEQLYYQGKKNFNSYQQPKPRFRGRFTNYQPSWYEEYLEVKNRSLLEALDINADVSKLDVSAMKTKMLMDFRQNNPNVTVKELAKGFGMTEREVYRRFAKEKPLNGALKPPSIILPLPDKNDTNGDVIT